MDKKFDKPNNGALFAVKSKTNPTQPDYRGDIMIDLKTFEVVNNTIKVSLSGWKKPMSTGGVFLSLQAQKPYVKDESQPYQRKQVIQDDDIPF